MTADANELPPLDKIEGHVAANLVGYTYPPAFNVMREALPIGVAQNVGKAARVPGNVRRQIPDEVRRTRAFDSSNAPVIRRMAAPFPGPQAIWNARFGARKLLPHVLSHASHSVTSTWTPWDRMGSVGIPDLGARLSRIKGQRATRFTQIPWTFSHEIV